MKTFFVLMGVSLFAVSPSFADAVLEIVSDRAEVFQSPRTQFSNMRLGLGMHDGLKEGAVCVGGKQSEAPIRKNEILFVAHVILESTIEFQLGLQAILPTAYQTLSDAKLTRAPSDPRFGVCGAGFMSQIEVGKTVISNQGGEFRFESSADLNRVRSLFKEASFNLAVLLKPGETLTENDRAVIATRLQAEFEAWRSTFLTKLGSVTTKLRFPLGMGTGNCDSSDPTDIPWQLESQKNFSDFVDAVVTYYENPSAKSCYLRYALRPYSDLN